MLIYNTLTRKKEKFQKPKGKPLRLFVCGPTVYDETHIGHARTYISFDVIAKFLRFRNINLKYAMNITNIDDKIIARARQMKTDPLKLSEKYEKSFRDAMKAIGADSVDIFARASDYIPEVIGQIQTLIKKGYAYEIKNNGYYFNISKFKKYGKLSGRTTLQAEDSISRIDKNIKKKNKGDFCLWKFVKTNKRAKFVIEKGEPAWNTHLGYGRPGWHIEDTAITQKLFGVQYDMHGGAVDLKFPHHEAEIAQQECASGKSPFVKYWLHTGFLLVNGKKMSKSLKNFITIPEFLGKNKNEWEKRSTILRLIILGTHYRSPIDFSKKTEEQAEGTYNNLSFFLDALNFISKKGKRGKTSIESKKIIKNMETKFIAKMEDDFSTPGAIASIFEVLGKISPYIFSLSKNEAKEYFKNIKKLLSVLGLSLSERKIPEKIEEIAEKRDLFRGNKQFVQADVLRKKIHKLGYEVNDTPLGSFIRIR